MLGDSALILRRVGPPRWRSAADFADALRVSAPLGVQEIVCAFDGVAICFDLAIVAAEPGRLQSIRKWADRVFQSAPVESAAPTRRRHVISIIYGGEIGCDLRELSRTLALPVDEIVRLHSSAEYEVLAVGFMPGFAYLGGLPTALQAPRRETPRTRVSAGAVGIGGRYSGIYPFASPGGWNLIGHTDVKLFDPSAGGALLHVGDTVTFSKVDD